MPGSETNVGENSGDHRRYACREDAHSAFMVPDPLDVVEEGEIHVGFSSSFSDRFPLTFLHDMDVLVARMPANLPSDIQKVRPLGLRGIDLS